MLELVITASFMFIVNSPAFAFKGYLTKKNIQQCILCRIHKESYSLPHLVFVDPQDPEVALELYRI